MQEGGIYFETSLKAVWNHTDLPLVATMSFNSAKREYRSLVGVDPKSGANALAETGLMLS